MPTTGVLLMPPSAGNSSIAGKLIEHLSHRFPECEHREFSLDYRLFSDTSSQIPGSDIAQRCFTHIFTSSHDPERGYLRTTRPSRPDEGECITIAAESVEPFVNLTLTKMQPLWYHRQHLSVEDGVSVSLKSDEWVLSIGDVKMASKFSGSNTLRGTVIELHHAVSSAEDEHSAEESAQENFRDVLNKIFNGTGESFLERTIILDTTLQRVSDPRTSRPADLKLVHMYMQLLRGQR